MYLGHIPPVFARTLRIGDQVHRFNNLYAMPLFGAHAADGLLLLRKLWCENNGCAWR